MTEFMFEVIRSILCILFGVIMYLALTTTLLWLCAEIIPISGITALIIWYKKHSY